MTERQVYDRDGNPCSLDTLCRKEPAWAANRIRELKAEVERLRVSDVTRVAYRYVSIPTNPPTDLLISMATRLRHDFGILSPETQEAFIRSMSQLYEEVVGAGFYRFKCDGDHGIATGCPDPECWQREGDQE